MIKILHMIKLYSQHEKKHDKVSPMNDNHCPNMSLPLMYRFLKLPTLDLICSF